MPQYCQSVSVTLKYRAQIGRNTSKKIPRLISLAFSVCRDHNIMDLLQRLQHEILTGYWIVKFILLVLFSNLLKTDRSVWFWTVTLS